MNAASLQTVVTPPVAAAPTAQPGVVAGGGIAPVDGQGFTPVASTSAQAAPASSSGGSGTGKGIDPEKGIAAIKQALGEGYGEVVLAADGSVYIEKPSSANGVVTMSYVLVGKLDANKQLQVNPAIVEQVQAKAAKAERTLVKVGEDYVWQTTSEGADGKPVIQQVKATEEELQAYQQQMQAQQAQQAAKAKSEDRGDWQQKMGTVSSQLGLFGNVGQFVTALSSGPNPYSGKPGASWMSGWLLAQRLNGRAEGKLLPSWLTTGPVATALEFGLQGYGMLDMGNDIRTLRDYFGKKPGPGISLPVEEVAAKLAATKGLPLHEATALAETGVQIRVGEAALRQGRLEGLSLAQSTGGMAFRNMPGDVLSKTAPGSLQLIEKDAAQLAYNATDPLQSKGMAVKGAVDSGINNGLGVLKGLIQPAMIGASALNAISSGITLKGIVEKNGAKVLVDTQQGRGALLGGLSSVAFLGLYTLGSILPKFGMGMPAVGATMSAVNIAANVLGGVEMMNRYGLFGGDGGKKGGFLDNDAFRAGFLIPPLTPIGAFAFLMKHRQKKADAEAEKVAAEKQAAAQKLMAQRDAARAQLQSTGQIAGGTAGQDGTITVSLGSAGAAAPAASAAASSGAAAEGGAASSGGSQQLPMVAYKPMR